MAIKKTIALIFISLCATFLIACSSAITRENNPEQFDLLRTGVVNKANVIAFKDCIIQGSEVQNRIAYNVTTRGELRNKGYRVDSYAGETLLLLSADISNSGQTQLFRVKNSELTDLTIQINAYDNCLKTYQ